NQEVANQVATNQVVTNQVVANQMTINQAVANQLVANQVTTNQATDNEQPRAQDLLCVFASFFEKYKSLGLLECEMKESQIIWHADSKKPRDRLQLYHTFFSELVQIQMHLRNFSLCEKHYNQLIISDFLHQILLSSNLPSNLLSSLPSNLPNNRRKHAETEAKINICNIMQANKQTNEVAVQASNKTYKIKDLKKQLKYAYNYVIGSWERVQEINKINKELTEQNN
ncbi:19737_t:CDS:2, partial [Racocetra fulgida]